MKGILFRPELIKAIVEGRKTVTRRTSGLDEINKEPDRWTYHEECSSPKLGRFTFFYDNQKPYNRQTAIVTIKPRYLPGETVYIKEAWAEFGDTVEAVRNGDLTPSEARDYIIYKMNHPDWIGILRDMNNGHPWSVKSPLFMPEWAARHFLLITDVRAERLQEITLSDIYDEGIDVVPSYDRIDAYKKLWDSINPKYPYSSNPWVFRYEFTLK